MLLLMLRVTRLGRAVRGSATSEITKWQWLDLRPTTCLWPTIYEGFNIPMLGLVMGYCGAFKGRAAWRKMPYVCCMQHQIRGETTELSPDSTPLRTEGLRQMSFHGSNSSSDGMLACSTTDRSARDLQWRLANREHGPETQTRRRRKAG